MSNQPKQDALLSKKEIKITIQALDNQTRSSGTMKEVKEIEEIIKKLKLWIK